MLKLVSFIDSYCYYQDDITGFYSQSFWGKFKIRNAVIAKYQGILKWYNPERSGHHDHEVINIPEHLSPENLYTCEVLMPQPIGYSPKYIKKVV